MKEKIIKIKDEIHFIVPFWSKRSNPYMLDQDVGEYQTLTGIICKDKDGNDELGFALTIDMSYKNKGDQWTDIKYHFWGDKKEFKKLCKNLKIGWVDYSLADYTL